MATKSTPALINPAMLVWARETARLSFDEAARKIGIAAEKLVACEAGEAQLTFPQFMKTAREYRRPASLFYLKTPPAGWAPIQDFRRLEGEIALELRSDLNEPVVPFTLEATTGHEEETLGQEIRTYLGVTDAEQQHGRATPLVLGVRHWKPRTCWSLWFRVCHSRRCAALRSLSRTFL